MADPSNPAPYDDDLAYVQASGFSEWATGATRAIVDRLRDAGVPLGRVYDLGCGAGTSTLVLTEAGARVVGVERSPALASLARRNAPGAKIRIGSLWDTPLEPCDAILAIGEPLTYHADGNAEARLSSFLATAARALVPGGALVFDLIEVGTPSLDTRGWRSGEDWAVLFETREDVGGRRLTRTIETFRAVDRAYRRAREVHEVTVFDAAWVLSALEAAGFSVITTTCYGSQALAPRRRAFFATRRGDAG